MSKLIEVLGYFLAFFLGSYATVQNKKKKTNIFQHPGGPDSLLEYAGLDGTVGFEEVGHSSDAR